MFDEDVPARSSRTPAELRSVVSLLRRWGPGERSSCNPSHSVMAALRTQDALNESRGTIDLERYFLAGDFVVGVGYGECFVSLQPFCAYKD